MIRWTGLAPWELEFSFPGSLAFTFLEARRTLGREREREGERKREVKHAGSSK